LIDLTTGDVRILERGGCASPSVDKTRVAWIPGPSTRNAVWALDLRSLEKRKLTGDMAAGCLSWSPDRRRIAATVIAARARTVAWGDILIIATDTGRTEQAISDEDLMIGQPSWNPDSQRLVFAVYKLEVFRTGPNPTDIGFDVPVSRVDMFDLRDRRRPESFQMPREAYVLAMRSML